MCVGGGGSACRASCALYAESFKVSTYMLQDVALACDGMKGSLLQETLPSIGASAIRIQMHLYISIYIYISADPAGAAPRS